MSRVAEPGRCVVGCLAKWLGTLDDVIITFEAHGCGCVSVYPRLRPLFETLGFRSILCRRIGDELLCGSSRSDREDIIARTTGVGQSGDDGLLIRALHVCDYDTKDGEKKGRRSMLLLPRSSSQLHPPRTNAVVFLPPDRALRPAVFRVPPVPHTSSAHRRTLILFSF